MAPKKEIGWDHAVPHNGDKRKPRCNYCNRTISGGITRLKEHLAHKAGQVEGCQKVSSEVMLLMRKAITDTAQEKRDQARRNEEVIHTLRHDADYGYGGNVDSDDDDDDGDDEVGQLERRQLRQAMRQSRRLGQLEEDGRRLSTSVIGGRPFRPSQAGSSQASGSHASGSYAGPSQPRTSRTFSLREDLDQGRGNAADSLRGIDPYMFRSNSAKQKKIKSAWGAEGLKKVGKAVSKWMHFNAIPFNAADSGPYYQTMIDTIAEAGSGIRGPSGKEIGGKYLKEEVAELKEYIENLKKKWPVYGCTIMCDGWSSHNKHHIINFMVYCDRDMIFHRSVDATNQKKTTDYLFKLMDEVVEEVG